MNRLSVSISCWALYLALLFVAGVAEATEVHPDFKAAVGADFEDIVARDRASAKLARENDAHLTALSNIAAAVRAAKIPFVDPVMVALDEEPASSSSSVTKPTKPKRTTPYIVLALWTQQFPSGTDLRIISEGLQKAYSAVANVVKSVKGSDKYIFEVRHASPPEMRHSHSLSLARKRKKKRGGEEENLFAAVVSNDKLDYSDWDSSVNALQAATIAMAKATVAPTAPPTPAPKEPERLRSGFFTAPCDTPFGGTLGGFLQDDSGNFYALSAAHVFDPTNNCRGTQPTAHRVIPAAALAPKKVLFSSAAPEGENNPDIWIPASYKAVVPTEWFVKDVGYVRIKPGVMISCRGSLTSIGGDFPITGLRKKDERGYVADIGARVTKFGFTTGRTYGVVHAWDEQNNLYYLKGIAPDVPLPMPRCANPWCGKAATAYTRRAALCGEYQNGDCKAKKDGIRASWEPRVFSAHGDSGSIVYDSSGNVVCLIHAGWFTETLYPPEDKLLNEGFAGLTHVDYTACRPILEVMKFVNTHQDPKPLGKNLRFCTDPADEFETREAR